MSKPKSAFEIFKLLDKSNCRECGEKTCLAFAGAVFLGNKKLQACPRLNREALGLFGCATDMKSGDDQSPEGSLDQLKSELADIDLSAAAERVGGRYDGRKLTLKVLGKDFSVDAQGNFYTEIHVNHWIIVPLLNHILSGQGLPVSGKWVSFRELKEGRDRYPLFKKRCEEPMKRVADVYTPLFEDLVNLFGGQKVDQQFESDISVVLQPLPKVPVMICYWLPEEGMNSMLHIFLDETADRNLKIGSVYTLVAGLAQMFTKIALRHGFTDAAPASPR